MSVLEFACKTMREEKEEGKKGTRTGTHVDVERGRVKERQQEGDKERK